VSGLPLPAAPEAVPGRRRAVGRVAGSTGGRLVVLALVVAIVGAPLAAIVLQAVAEPAAGGLWAHLLATVFWTYVGNTLVLCLGVGAITLVVGTGTAWLVAMYRFPGRRLFEWGLVLPLAMPAYVLAYAYTDVFQVTGPLHTLWREMTGVAVGAAPLPRMHSLGGAVFVLSFAFYPYVYLLARAAFNEQSVCALEVSRTLGCRAPAAFWRVALPMARPAIATGVAFALMETLADFGAVKFFGIQTYTTGIYRAWYATADPSVAAQLASALLLFVFVVLAIERLGRSVGRHRHTTSRYRALSRERLAGAAGIAAALGCALPILLGFALPAAALAAMAADGGDDLPTLARLLALTGNTLMLAALASAVVVAAALAAVYALRGDAGILRRLAMLFASLGYAAPGVVIAIGILIAVGAADRVLGEGLRQVFGIAPGLLLGGSLAAVVYGCLVRFFAVAYGPLEAALAKIKPSYEDAARLLRGTPACVLRHVHLPLMRSSLVTAALMVFVDVMKELPATMILRPFNFDTLAVEAFQLATTERLDAAAVPALLIVAAGLVPVILLCRTLGRARPGAA
jgi:iron(III) transport system permease protein